MAEPAHSLEVYLEIGKKRIFAAAIDWPGWCRSGRDEASALQALFDYGPRYASALSRSHTASRRSAFTAPSSLSELSVVERLEGNATTDFGAPDAVPSSDLRPFDKSQVERCQAILKACWGAFDAAALAAEGKELRKGPRGGGRELEGIVSHVQGAGEAYLGKLGWKVHSEGATCSRR